MSLPYRPPPAISAALVVCALLCAQASAEQLSPVPELWRVYGANADGADADSILLSESEMVLRRLARRRPDTTGPARLATLGAFRFGRGDLPEAERLLSEAVARYRRTGDSAPRLEFGRALVFLGRCRTESGEYEEAETALEEAVLIYRAMYRRVDPAEYAAMLRAAAWASRNRAAYTKAVIRFGDALGMRRRIAQGRDTPEVAESMVDLAMLDLERGAYARAWKLLTDALGMYNRLLGQSDDPAQLRCLIVIARYRHLRGQEKKARGTFNNALAAFARLRPSLSASRVGRLLVDLGALSLELADTGRAQSELLEAVDALGSIRGVASTFERARAESLLAQIAVDRGDRVAAKPHLDTATDLYDALCAEHDHPARAHHLCTVAAYEALGHRWKRADAAFDSASAMFHRMYVRAGRLDLALGILRIGRTAERYGMGNRAAVAWRDLLHVLPSATRESGTFEGEEAQILLRRQLSEAAATLARWFLEHDAAAELCELSLWQKGRVLASVEWRNRVVAEMRRGDPELAASWKRYVELLRSESPASELNEASAPDGGPLMSRVSADAAPTAVEEVIALAERMEDSLVARGAALKTGRHEITWKGIVGRLGSHECAVDFMRVARENQPDSATYYALILRRGRPAPVVVRLCDERVLADALREPVAAPVADARSYVHDAGRAAALYRAVWAPLERWVGGATRLYISPDGLLNRLAFGVLQDTSGMLLRDRFDLRTLYSLRDLVPPPVIGGGRTERTAAVIGAVRYACDSATAPKARVLRPLGASEGEAAGVSAVLARHGFMVTTYTGADATGAAFLRLESPTVLHVAAHAYALVDSGASRDTSRSARLRVGRAALREVADPLLRSGLLLAGADCAWADETERLGPRNGVMTAFDIAPMDLSGTELVVLSACETGLGDIMAGEGVMGLKRAFRAAGAKTVLMSLWKVPDRQTSELIQLFYRNWLDVGMEKATALREAQREMAKSHDPYFWGAFVLVGE